MVVIGGSLEVAVWLLGLERVGIDSANFPSCFLLFSSSLVETFMSMLSGLPLLLVSSSWCLSECPSSMGPHSLQSVTSESGMLRPKSLVTQVYGKVVQHEEMSLLERISLLNHIEYSPLHCTKCGCQNLEHLEMECPMYKQCMKCYCWGPRDFVSHHLCCATSDVSWGANADYYEEEWYQGHD